MTEEKKGYHVVVDIDDVEGFIAAFGGVAEKLVNAVGMQHRLILAEERVARARLAAEQCTDKCDSEDADTVKIPADAWDTLKRLASVSKLRVKNAAALEMISIIKNLK